MDNNIFGFRLGLSDDPACTLSDLAEHIVKMNGESLSFYGQDIRVFGGMKAETCIGAILTVTDASMMTTFTEREEGNDKVREVRIHKAEQGEYPFEFNFFAFVPTKGEGVYQHYRGSMRMSNFGKLLGLFYDDLAKNVCCATADTFRNRTPKERRLKGDTLAFDFAMKKRDFEQEVEKWRRIKRVAYTISVPQDQADADEPLSPYVRSIREEVRFNTTATGKKVRSGLMALASNAVGAFRVEGTNEDGEEMSLSLEPKPTKMDTSPLEDFWVEEDEDEAINLTDIAASPFVGKMEACLTDFGEHFGSPAPQVEEAT